MKYFASKLSENIAETPEGYLICIGVPVARTGEMEYAETETPLKGVDGKVVISRDEKEVFRPQTIASFEGKPLTIKHPEKFVNPENWKDLAKGIMKNVRRGEGEFSDSLIADILITDQMAISLVKNGLRGLSCGYEAEYTQTGEGTGTQTDIVGNHLALVEEGRAGAGYEIKDSKGVTDMTKSFIDFANAFLARKKTKDAEPVEKKEEKAKDEEEVVSDEMKMYDEFKKQHDAMGKMLDAMKPGAKDKESKPENAEPAVEDDEEVSSSLEDRLKALEAVVSKLMEQESGDESEEESEDEEKEEMVGDEEEEVDDAEMCDMVGDTAARVEILAPGLKASGKDAKVKALKASYGTKEGKKVIDQFTGGKAPAYDSKEKVDVLFIAASEVLKASRNQDLTKTKARSQDSSGVHAGVEMTAEKINEINAKVYQIK